MRNISRYAGEVPVSKIAGNAAALAAPNIDAMVASVSISCGAKWWEAEEVLLAGGAGGQSCECRVEGALLSTAAEVSEPSAQHRRTPSVVHHSSQSGGSRWIMGRALWTMRFLHGGVVEGRVEARIRSKPASYKPLSLQVPCWIRVDELLRRPPAADSSVEKEKEEGAEEEEAPKPHWDLHSSRRLWR